MRKSRSKNEKSTYREHYKRIKKGIDGRVCDE